MTPKVHIPDEEEVAKYSRIGDAVVATGSEREPIRNIVKQQSASKLSQEEQESRRAIKRFRRQRRSERLLRARRGQSAWLRQAKAVGRLTRAIQRSLPHLSAEEARRSAKASIKASRQVEDETKRHMQREIHGA